MGKWIKRLVLGLVLAAIIAGGYQMTRPQPVSVDIVEIARGEIETTIDEEGMTRVKDVYRISAPISGKLERLKVQAGDGVIKGERIARLRPADPPIRDARTRREMRSATKTARAGVQLAKAEVAKAGLAHDFAKSDLKRAKRLAASKTISTRTLQQAELDVAVKNAQLAEANASLEFRRRELESAQTRELMPTQLTLSDVQDQCCVAVVTPVSGTVLKLLTESEQVVQAGTPLVDVGNLGELEIVVDLLSTDAVNIVAGTRARIEGWGGDSALNAEVRRKNPAGFTKVSALGIEEQRVNAVLDLTDPVARWRKLGHSFRVTVRLITSYNQDALRLPLGALFRQNEDWMVYAENEGKAVRTKVKLGKFSLTHAEVLEGLVEGDHVVVYPSDRVSDGTVVEVRGQAG